MAEDSIHCATSNADNAKPATTNSNELAVQINSILRLVTLMFEIAAPCEVGNRRNWNDRAEPMRENFRCRGAVTKRGLARVQVPQAGRRYQSWMGSPAAWARSVTLSDLDPAECQPDPAIAFELASVLADKAER